MKLRHNNKQETSASLKYEKLTGWQAGCEKTTFILGPVYFF